jgi:hypothetical protein
MQTNHPQAEVRPISQFQIDIGMQKSREIQKPDEPHSEDTEGPINNINSIPAYALPTQGVWPGNHG